MKYISAHQAQFIPQLSFFAKIKTVDTYVCLDDLKYSRHSFQTRNKIKIDSNEGWTYLLVPVKKTPQGQILMNFLLTIVQIGKKNI